MLCQFHSGLNLYSLISNKVEICFSFIFILLNFLYVLPILLRIVIFLILRVVFLDTNPLLFIYIYTHTHTHIYIYINLPCIVACLHAFFKIYLANKFIILM